MTTDDLTAVERHSNAVAHELGASMPPVMKPADFDRIDIDVTYIPNVDVHEFVEKLAMSLHRQGYAWDVWLNGLLVSVSEREEAE